MTIEFSCPNCDRLIAFDSKHIGKRARCQSCDQLFIIPSQNYGTVEKISSEPEKEEPIPGFYRALFAESWKIFVKSANVTGLVFVTAAVCFKFFTGDADYSFDIGAGRFQAPVGLVVSVTAWGCLFWYYMEIIYSSAYNDDQLPDVGMGSIFGFFWNTLKSVCIFAMSFLLVELPCVIVLFVFRKLGIKFDILLYVLALGGIFFLPMILLAASVGKDVDIVLGINQTARAVCKAIKPYFVVALLFILVWAIQLKTVDYSEVSKEGRLIIALSLLGQLGVQVVAIIAMRSIGLFYRHYNCYLPW